MALEAPEARRAYKPGTESQARSVPAELPAAARAVAQESSGVVSDSEGHKPVCSVPARQERMSVPAATADSWGSRVSAKTPSW
jgi:hypothetical protein